MIEFVTIVTFISQSLFNPELIYICNSKIYFSFFFVQLDV